MQALQERFGGWNSSEIVPLFAQYAATVFQAFGSRVTHWTTMNEPQTFCFSGYSSGGNAPGVRSLVRQHMRPAIDGKSDQCDAIQTTTQACKSVSLEAQYYWANILRSTGCMLAVARKTG